MRSHLEFRLANADRLAVHSIALRLRAALVAHGWDCGVICEEDWGYGIPVLGAPFRLRICLGLYAEYPDGILIFTDPAKSRIRRMLRSISTQETLEPLTKDIEHAVRDVAGSYALRWWSEEEVSDG